MAATTLPTQIAIRCRDVAAALLGGLWIGRDSAEVAHQIAGLSTGRQAAFTLGALGLLLAFSFFAAQFGLIGLAIFWLGVILVVS